MSRIPFLIKVIRDRSLQSEPVGAPAPPESVTAETARSGLSTAMRERQNVTTSATEFETDLIDLSRCGLQEVMALRDSAVVDALSTLVRHLGERAAAQSASGGDGSPHLAVDCSTGRH